MQPGSDAAAPMLLTGIELCGEHEHGIGVRDGFDFLERRSLVLCQDFLKVINRLSELLCRGQRLPRGLRCESQGHSWRWAGETTVNNLLVR